MTKTLPGKRQVWLMIFSTLVLLALIAATGVYLVVRQGRLMRFSAPVHPEGATHQNPAQPATLTPLSGSLLSTPANESRVEQESAPNLLPTTRPTRSTPLAPSFEALPETGLPAEGWPMAGANPARTSATTEEVRGELAPVWFTPLEPYISQKVQITAGQGALFISTSAGLYALDAASGKQRWFYPTELPLGHSPTLHAGVLYVGGFDKKIHAIAAGTGQAIWTFEAKAGFSVNPLVTEGKVLAGSRDGTFYAIHASGEQAGQPAWKFQTGGPILFSAAYAEGVVYFASNDNHAYALRVADGSLVWQSDKLPGHGFHSWWPVVYQDYVIFPGSYNYRFVEPFPAPHTELERDEAFPAQVGEKGAIGPSIQSSSGRPAVQSSAAHYLAQKPHRRTYFVIDRATGQELNLPGQALAAPVLWFGTHSGTRYPPAVGPDGVLYQSNKLHYSSSIPRGGVSGWDFGTAAVHLPPGSETAVDEPLAYSIGGNVIYWKRCCDRMAGAFEIGATAGSPGKPASWVYFDEGGRMLRRSLPALFEQGWDFAYWKHGDQSPPIPYQGRVYMIINNAVAAFAPQGLTATLRITPDQRGPSGEKAGDIQHGQTFTALNGKVTLDETHWPRLIQQETYYNPNDRPDAPARWFRLLEVAAAEAVASAGTEPVPQGLDVQEHGITTLLTSRFASTGSLKTWASQRSPATLFENSASSYLLHGRFTGLAYVSANGIQIVSGPFTLNGAELSEGWLLAWDAGSLTLPSEPHRWSPLVISLARRPEQVMFSPDGLRLTYSGPAGYLAVTPLHGMSTPYPTEAEHWVNGLPEATLTRLRQLDRVARAFPLQVSEEWDLAPDSGDVTLSYAYTHLQIPDEWGVDPLPVAFLPPQLALAAWNSTPDDPAGITSPIRIEGKPLAEQLDLVYVTPLGRVAGVPNSETARVLLPGLASYWRNPAPASNPASARAPANDPLHARLTSEIEKMLAAGHLLPGYGLTGIWDARARTRLGDDLADYYHNPADTVYTLLLALPLLPPDLQDQVRDYVKAEVKSYPLHDTAHTGWEEGANRSNFDLPPEVLAAAKDFGPRKRTEFNNWGLPPHNFYALWLYAREFGGAADLFKPAQDRLNPRPRFQASMPYVLNSYLAGYIGYLRLAELARTEASPETQADARPKIEKRLIDLFILRAALAKYPEALARTGFEYGGYAWSLRKFSPDQPETLFSAAIAGSLWSQMSLYGLPLDPIYNRSGAPTGGDYAFGIDFVNLTPEVGRFLNQYAPAETSASVVNYAGRAPYWFAARAEEAGGEGVFQPLYERAAYFQARALALQHPRHELEPYLDVPAFATGDLFYIQNLVFTLSTRE